jgi:uncharacterized lipoprotein YajG
LATVRGFSIACLVMITAVGTALGTACGRGQIHNLPLVWTGVDDVPQPSASVARSFAAAPFTFGLRDLRQDPTAVGKYEDDGFVVRTSDNVAQYCSTKMGEMLVRAGARLTETPTAVLEAELLDFQVIEGGVFNGLARIRAIVRRGVEKAWSKTYVGKSKRWGRTHNPDNFNEALSSALVDVTKQLVQDDELAQALAPPHSSSPGG